uniref:Uncharacterized protein n=1 Tax=Rhodosorus marinus TaxID=101924 RepID=A0A7S3EKV4_9RHOD
MFGFVGVGISSGSYGLQRRDRTALCASDAAVFSEYLEDVANLKAPKYLRSLLDVLEAKGEKIGDPSKRAGLHPFLIPISSDEEGTTGFLRWPTPPPDMEVPIVRNAKGEMGLTLLSTGAENFIKRHMAELDSAAKPADVSVPEELQIAEGEVESLGFGLERYVILKIGPFPDIYEGLTRFHEIKGDMQSALVCAERSGVAFPGWARGHCFHARLLQRFNRNSEARDAARYALQLPLWTLGDSLQEMGQIAGYQDETSLQKIFKRLAEDERENEIKDGKPKEQVALDRAAYLMDYTYAAGGSWDEIKDELAALYNEGMVTDSASFLKA